MIFLKFMDVKLVASLIGEFQLLRNVLQRALLNTPANIVIHKRGCLSVNPCH